MIKKINSANAGVKRPLRASDLQDLWTAITLMHAQDNTTGIFILYGFNDKGDGNLSAGVVMSGGVLYYHPDVVGYRIAIDANVYGTELDGVDERVFDDASTQDFSFNMIASTVASAVDLGVFSLNYIQQHRKATKYREVTGVLSFTVLDVGAGSFDKSFTPDNDEDDDVIVNATIVQTAKTLGFKIEDGDGNRMKKDFVIIPEASAGMLTVIAAGESPDIMLASDVGDASDIIAYFSGNVVDTTAGSIDYRLKILFDV